MKENFNSRHTSSGGIDDKRMQKSVEYWYFDRMITSHNRFHDGVVKRIFAPCIDLDVDCCFRTLGTVALMKSSISERDFSSKKAKTRFFGFFVADVSSEEIGTRQQIEQAMLYKT